MLITQSVHWPFVTSIEPASVAHLDARLTGDYEVAGSTPPDRQHSFVEIDHKIVSTVIFYLPLIKKGSCQFLAKEICILLINRLEG